MNGPSPYKGVPRAEWGPIKERLREERQAAQSARSATLEAVRARGESAPGQAAPAEARADPPDEVIPPNLFSGQVRKLDVQGLNPDFRHRWFNDEGDNIARAVRSAWAYVNRDEVQLYDSATPRNNDLGSHVRQYVGVASNGEPMYAYLMRKPIRIDEQHQFGRGSREDYNRQIEAQIRAGTLNQSVGDGRYTADKPPVGSQSSLPAISIRTPSR